jgi:hypothetical protein
MQHKRTTKDTIRAFASCTHENEKKFIQFSKLKNRKTLTPSRFPFREATGTTFTIDFLKKEA